MGVVRKNLVAIVFASRSTSCIMCRFRYVHTRSPGIMSASMFRSLCSTPDNRNSNTNDGSDSIPSKDGGVGEANAYEIAQQFNPPARFKRSFPTGIIGALQVA
jgi:hypothetical protein